MHLDTFAYGDEAENGVAIDRVAAMGQLEVYSLQIFIDDEHVVVLSHHFLGRILILELGSTGGRTCGVGHVQVVVAFGDVFLNDAVGVYLLLGNVLVEIRVLLVAHLLDGACHDALLYFQLSVLESSLQEFLGKETFLLLCLLDGEADLGLGFRGLHDVDPFLTWLLVALCQDFYLVARVQLLSEAYCAPVDLSSHTGVADT